MPDIRYNFAVEAIADNTDFNRDNGIIILGTSSQGTSFDLEPKTYNIEQAIETFGSGEIVTGCQEATLFDNGVHVYLIRIGAEGMNDADRYAALEVAYDAIKASPLNASVIVPLGTHLESNQNFHLQLAETCHEMLNLGYGTMGIMGTLGLNYTLLKDYLTINRGKYISIFSGRPILYTEQLDRDSITAYDSDKYISSGEALYASLIASLNIGESPTNKPVPILHVEDNYSYAERTNLSKLGIVTLRNTIRRGWVIHQGTTMSSLDSYKGVSNVRTIISIDNAIRQIAEDYIGSPVFQAIYITEESKAYLDKLVLEEKIRKYSLKTSLEYDTLEIELDIVPIYETITIDVDVRLKLRRG